MSLIKKAAELEITQTVKMMIYGQAGMGKTTLALSAPKPLLLDFDGGVKRVNDLHLQGVDIVQIREKDGGWAVIQQLLNPANAADLAPYRSIVVDTIGKMIDFIIIARCGTRQPSIKDWGGINQEFQWFTRALSSLDKNIIFVAHRDTRKEGDETVFIPSLREKNYNSIVTELDLLGYLEMRSDGGRQRRTVTFDPTSRNDGKNTCNLPAVMEIPTILSPDGNKATAPNDFIDRAIIRPYLAMLAQKAEQRRKYDEVVEMIRENIELITDARSANQFAAGIDQLPHVGSSLALARGLFAQKVKTLGLVYDKETKTYQDAAA